MNPSSAFILICLSTFCVTPTAFAELNSSYRQEHERFESVSLANTQIRKIKSTYTAQNYRIDVSIPASYYDCPGKKYPAIVTLDADYSFAIAKKISEHLSDRNHIPEAFIFSVAYDGPPNYRINRTRDYTPTHVPDGGYGPEIQKYSGGGPQFAEFLQKELIPYLQKAFRLSEQKILVSYFHRRKS